MSDKKNDGGAAFPNMHECVDDYPATGMTLHDWFAGQALVGIIAINPEISQRSIAECAYAQADAMIVERDKKS